MYKRPNVLKRFWYWITGRVVLQPEVKVGVDKVVSKETAVQLRSMHRTTLPLTVSFTQVPMGGSGEQLVKLNNSGRCGAQSGPTVQTRPTRFDAEYSAMLALRARQISDGMLEKRRKERRLQEESEAEAHKRRDNETFYNPVFYSAPETSSHSHSNVNNSDSCHSSSYDTGSSYSDSSSSSCSSD